MERRIRERGVRVDERLALLALLQAPDPAARLAAENARLRQVVEDAVAAVRGEALRGEASRGEGRGEVRGDATGAPPPHTPGAPSARP